MGEFGDEIGGYNRANMVAVIMQVWRYTRWLTATKLTNTLGSRNEESLETDLEGIINQEWRSMWRRSAWRQSIGGTLGAGTQFIR